MRNVRLHDFFGSLRTFLCQTSLARSQEGGRLGEYAYCSTWWCEACGRTRTAQTDLVGLPPRVLAVVLSGGIDASLLASVAIPADVVAKAAESVLPVRDLSAPEM